MKSIFLAFSIFLIASCSGNNPEHNSGKGDQKNSDPEREISMQFDKWGRLAAHSLKREITCPAQDKKTAVLLIVGQSNSANHAQQKYQSNFGERNINFFNGKCFVSDSPQLGGTEKMGEYWTNLGNKILEQGLYDKVVFVPTAVTGAAIVRWTPGSDLFEMLHLTLDSIKPIYKITHILFHQGESDFGYQTTEKDYRSRFEAMLSSIRSRRIGAPIFVSVATACSDEWYDGNPVMVAQKGLVNPKKKIFAGIDTDALLVQSDRYDKCHFGITAQEKATQAWIEVLKKHH